MVNDVFIWLMMVNNNYSQYDEKAIQNSMVPVTTNQIIYGYYNQQ